MNGGSLKAQVEEALGVLVGLPLEDAGRAYSLQWFSFGEVRVVPDHKGGTRELGEYALHVQCEWRITGPGGIVVGINDRSFPAGDAYSEPQGFDWNVQGANRLDERLSRFMEERRSRPLVVERIWADHVGSIRLLFGDGYSLDVFPFESTKYEYWRLFRPGISVDGSEPHFVVTGEGITD
ncbi:MAG: hypothetical protein M3441_13195 [Chloroflexota bacterium]|nr:hypothetical protein [Chloroflexota bacterium]